MSAVDSRLHENDGLASCQNKVRAIERLLRGPGFAAIAQRCLAQRDQAEPSRLQIS
jgi:hypothetical protein